ncbi:fatty acid desaturase [Tropicibacter naphthalenivorans]|uniref:Fatty acid desaturase n=1 Tax=Tropicibacter naphthalenivorans TaxID=441103 RepID=A0A0P1GKN6_9RHOB|nr:fatty acid desaturase [Tropicibacter naphthalenivorans]CUH82582.1 Fatty acid desaturase [Tropicibacter naphthalenivorans]SMD09415.1 Fatty acid desaturase [Tropicibacter naphthalenivorans]
MARDYSMTGPDARRAVASGLVTEKWYRTPIDRKVMKALMKRSDQPATRDTVLLFGLMALFAGGAIAVMPSWWALPLWLAYGVLYGSAMDSRWHECGHGTAFKTRWKNSALYQIASFCMIRDPYCWKYSHARHHSDTIIVGRDPEVAIMRPVMVLKMLANLVGLLDFVDGIKRMGIHASGRMLPDEQDYVAPVFHPKTVRTSRIWLGIYAVTVAAALVFQSWVPLLLIGLPRLFGCWHMVLTGWLQHGGLADNVLDHRLNCRTVYMNPVSRFIYWNMNYHVEHHMFPLVPFSKLPELHRACAWDFPAPNASIRDGYAEMLPALWRQRTDPDFHLRRPLPETANPYHDGPAAQAA